MIKNNKEKTFTGNVHIFSNDDSKLPLSTTNVIEVIAEDKNEARTKINKVVTFLNSKVTLGHDKQATKYINRIW